MLNDRQTNNGPGFQFTVYFQALQGPRVQRGVVVYLYEFQIAVNEAYAHSMARL